MNSETGIQPRSIYIDLIRGMAILFVCFGHCIQYGSGAYIQNSGEFMENKGYMIIYSFHMPLFAIVSGYLFWKSIQKYQNISECFIHKFCTLILPGIVWNTIRTVISILIGKNALSLKLLWKWIEMCYYDFWFFWAIFVCSLIVYIVHKYFNDSVWIYILLIPVMLILPDYLNFSFYKFLYPFFIGAYLVHKSGILEKINGFIKITMFIGSSIIWIILLPLYTWQYLIYSSGFSVLGKAFVRQIGIDGFRIIIGIVGSIFVIGVAYGIYWLKISCVSHVLGIVGRNTLGIYILSSYLNSILGVITANVDIYGKWYYYFVILAETCIIVFICLGFCMICRRNPLLDKYLLGGRWGVVSIGKRIK